MLALGPEDVVLDVGLLLAVIAQNFNYFVSELLRHRGGLDLGVKLAVLRPHVAEGLGAERALVLVLAELFEASFVEGMPTNG